MFILFHVHSILYLQFHHAFIAQFGEAFTQLHSDNAATVTKGLRTIVSLAFEDAVMRQQLGEAGGCDGTFSYSSDDAALSEHLM